MDIFWNHHSYSSHFTCCLRSRGFPSVVGRDLLTLKDFTKDEIRYFLWTAADLKERIKNGKEVGQKKVLVTILVLCKEK